LLCQHFCFASLNAALAVVRYRLERTIGCHETARLLVERHRIHRPAVKETIAAEMRRLWRRRAMQRGLVARELPMSQVMYSPLAPSKTLEEQAAEILALLEQIISTSPEMEEEEKIPA
jgi:hypothetical protein